MIYETEAFSRIHPNLSKLTVTMCGTSKQKSEDGLLISSESFHWVKKKILVLFHPVWATKAWKRIICQGLKLKKKKPSYICPRNAKFSPGFDLNPVVGRLTHWFLSLLTYERWFMHWSRKKQPSIKLRVLGCTKHQQTQPVGSLCRSTPTLTPSLHPADTFGAVSSYCYTDK